MNGLTLKRLTVGGVGLFIAATAGCDRNPAADNELTLHGNIDIRQVSLAFEGSGRVAQVRAEEGNSVQAGSVLATLDTTLLRLQAEEAAAQLTGLQQKALQLQNGSRPEDIAQAEARLVSAQADAAQAEDDLKRQQDISAATQGRGVAAQDVAHAQRNALAARARVKELTEALRLARTGPRREEIDAATAQAAAAQAKLDQLNYQIAQAELRAPVTGIVRARLLEVGDMASPQKPVFDIALSDPKWVRVYVSQSDLGRIRTGMSARVISDTYPDKPVTGQIGYISSVAEFTPKSVQTEELRTSLVYQARIRVEDRENRLRLGQPVTVKIALSGRPQ